MSLWMWPKKSTVTWHLVLLSAAVGELPLSIDALRQQKSYGSTGHSGEAINPCKKDEWSVWLLAQASLEMKTLENQVAQGGTLEVGGSC